MALVPYTMRGKGWRGDPNVMLARPKRKLHQHDGTEQEDRISVRMDWTDGKGKFRESRFTASAADSAEYGRFLHADLEANIIPGLGPVAEPETWVPPPPRQPNERDLERDDALDRIQKMANRIDRLAARVKVLEG